MIKRENGKILIKCDNCDNKVLKKITGKNLILMDGKMPEGWVFKGNKIYCGDCNNKKNKRDDNSMKLSKENWSGTV